MKRVRFTEHVMGLPGPEPVYHAGQVAEITDALEAVLDASASRHHAAPWYEEYDGLVETCPRCGKVFGLNDVVGHMMWLHDMQMVQAISERKNIGRPRGEGDLACIDCGRSFPHEQALKQHRTKVHRDGDENRRSGTGSP